MCRTGKKWKKAQMNEDDTITVVFIFCFIVAIVILFVGVYTNWTFDIEQAKINDKVKEEKESKELEHLKELYRESKTTTNCKILKDIRLEILAMNSTMNRDYNFLKDDIKEMAKERQEILCP